MRKIHFPIIDSGASGAVRDREEGEGSRDISSEELELFRMNDQLRDALADVKKLQGMLPICASCKKVRDDDGYWQQIESYISDHSDAKFSHGICPECMIKLYGKDFTRG